VAPGDKQALLYDDDSGDWYNGDVLTEIPPIKHSAHFSLSLPAIVVPPGPKNKTGANEWVFAVNVITNGAVSGTMTGGSFSFGAGGGELDIDLDATHNVVCVAPNARLSVTVSTQGSDGNYLAVSWGIRDTAGPTTGDATQQASSMYAGVL
jgi:hypothetical protein